MSKTITAWVNGAVQSITVNEITSYIEELDTSLGNNVYTQPDEPTDAPDGSLWVDTDEESQGGSGCNCVGGNITSSDDGNGNVTLALSGGCFC